MSVINEMVCGQTAASYIIDKYSVIVAFRRIVIDKNKRNFEFFNIIYKLLWNFAGDYDSIDISLQQKSRQFIPAFIICIYCSQQDIKVVVMRFKLSP